MHEELNHDNNIPGNADTIAALIALKKQLWRELKDLNQDDREKKAKIKSGELRYEDYAPNPRIRELEDAIGDVTRTLEPRLDSEEENGDLERDAERRAHRQR